MDMVIKVEPKGEQLDHLLPAALALIGAGVLKLFPGEVPVRITPAGTAGQVTCETAQGGYAKAGLYSAGFDVPTATGPAPAPPKDNVLTFLNVVPALPDGIDNDHYPAIGAAEFGMAAAKALCGAFVTQTIGANDDPYTGDPGTSMQVCCNEADVPRVISGFQVVRFRATVISALPGDPTIGMKPPRR
jgi:hypothetical protein